MDAVSNQGAQRTAYGQKPSPWSGYRQRQNARRRARQTAYQPYHAYAPGISVVQMAVKLIRDEIADKAGSA